MGSLSLCSLLFWSSEVEENHTFSWVQKKVLFLSFLLWENWDEYDFELGLEIAYKLSFGFVEQNVILSWIKYASYYQNNELV